MSSDSDTKLGVCVYVCRDTTPLFSLCTINALIPQASSSVPRAVFLMQRVHYSACCVSKNE